LIKKIKIKYASQIIALIYDKFVRDNLRSIEQTISKGDELMKGVTNSKQTKKTAALNKSGDYENPFTSLSVGNTR
jgi:hypothetical protein